MRESEGRRSYIEGPLTRGREPLYSYADARDALPLLASADPRRRAAALGRGVTYIYNTPFA